LPIRQARGRRFQPYHVRDDNDRRGRKNSLVQYIQPLADQTTVVMSCESRLRTANRRLMGVDMAYGAGDDKGQPDAQDDPRQRAEQLRLSQRVPHEA